jgi:hypothetical protein
MRQINGLPELEAVINKMAKDLSSYSTNVNANPKYIEIQNGLIEELVQINNNYMGLKYYEIWLHVEDNIAKIEAKDKSINAHMIKIITGISEHPFSSFTFKLNEQ